VNKFCHNCNKEIIPYKTYVDTMGGKGYKFCSINCNLLFRKRRSDRMIARSIKKARYRAALHH